jgi:ABC-type branched-subunit amino acid transport system substrate-binding protein
MKKIWIGLIAIVLVAGLGCFFLSKQEKKEKESVRIAFNIPLTGELATYGTAIRDGSLFAVDNIYSNDSTIKIICDFQDNASTPKNAVNIFLKQKNESPNVYVSGVKPQTMSIIDQVETLNIPHFTWIFDAFVTEKYKNAFRTWVNYKMEPTKILEYVDRVKAKKIAITYVQLPHTEEEYLDIIIPELKKRDIEYTVEKYNIEKGDFKDIATKFKVYNPDLMIINGFKANLIPLVRNFREYSLFNGSNALFTFDLLDASEELSADLLEGLKLVSPQFETREDNLQWKDSFKNKFYREPRYTDAYAYDMIFAIYTAYKQSNNKEEFINNLLSVNFKGITGDVTFDSSGDMVVSLDIAGYKNGRLVYEGN